MDDKQQIVEQSPKIKLGHRKIRRSNKGPFIVTPRSESPECRHRLINHQARISHWCTAQRHEVLMQSQLTKTLLIDYGKMYDLV